jgi:hypothetical protein
LRWTVPSRVVLVALVGTIVALNLNRYGPFEELLQQGVATTNAELAALQIARPAVADPSQRVNEPAVWQFRPKAYYAAIDAYGSPVHARQDLELAPAGARASADTVLVHVEKVTFRPGFVRFGAIRPRSGSGAALPAAGAGCGVASAGTGPSGQWVIAPPGGIIIRPAAGPLVGIGAARFADPSFAVTLPFVRAGTAAVIPIRADYSKVPWRFRLLGRQAVTVCSIAE